MTDPVARFSRPFVEMFEALRMAPVFARGRRDARAGHVRSLTISSSLVAAQVRGPGEPAAHRARIAVRAFGAAAWSRVEDELASQARYAADLLAGRMPAGIERVFADAGLNLLPLSLDEIAMDCSCEQWPMPCAHLAATVYAVARSFDADPFGAFAWRGRPRDELLHRLHQLRGAAVIEATGAAAEPASDVSLGDVADFWGSAFRGSALPGSALPGSALPGSALPGSALPGSALPDSAFPGSASPGSALPGSAFPGSTEGGAPSAPAPAAVRPDALLDQLDVPPPLAELLRPAYQALP